MTSLFLTLLVGGFGRMASLVIVLVIMLAVVSVALTRRRQVRFVDLDTMSNENLVERSRS